MSEKVLRQRRLVVLDAQGQMLQLVCGPVTNKQMRRLNRHAAGVGGEVKEITPKWHTRGAPKQEVVVRVAVPGLRQRIVEARVSQSELAAKAKLSNATVCRALKDERYQPALVEAAITCLALRVG